MTIFAPTSASATSIFRPWLKSRHGWIGIDIGTVATKLAQVERVGDQLQIAAQWTIDNYGGDPLTKDSLTSRGSFPFVSQLKEVRAMFRGRRAAATLPLSMGEVRAMELPPGSDDELRHMMHEELQADANEIVDLCFDYLPTQAADSAEGDMGTFSVFATPTSIATGATNSLSQAGLDCEVLDSLPCALARATQLCEPESPEIPLAALDFGHSAAMIVVARGGQLLFSRQLRGCSLQRLLKPLQDGLKLSSTEAQQLLCHYANSSAADSSPLGALAKSAHGLIAEPLAQTIAEVKRTLDFLDLQFRSIVPKKLILLGGGALVPALSSSLAEETSLPTRLWSLSSTTESPRPADALFGVAAALSSLAWEAAPCM